MKKTLILLLLLGALLFVFALGAAQNKTRRADARSKGRNVILRRAIIFR
jgi:hypothetical protein